MTAQEVLTLDSDYPELTLLTTPGPDSGAAERLLHAWVRDYLCVPHPDLGRDGPVCPLTRPSIEKGLFWACYDFRGQLDADDICALVRLVWEKFDALPPIAGPDSMLRAVVIAFPNLAHHDAIDIAQQRLKPEFVDEGLMIGQFYPGCTESGLWNADFRPLDSPLPMLAIRHMVSNDFSFLDSRPEWISAYLRKFAPSVPAPVRARLAGRAESAR